MAIYYIDLVSGNDSTGDGSSALPWKTFNKANTMATGGDEVRVAKTAAHTSIGAATCTFTNNSVTVSTSASLIGLVAVGDYIGKPTATGDGAVETFYRVTAVTSGSLTLEAKYYGATGAVASILKVVPSVHGSAGTVATLTKSITWSGGWDLGALVQNGETWFKQSDARATGIIYGVNNSATINWSKINIIECNYAFYSTASATVSNSTFSGSGVYNVSGAGAYTLTNIMSVSTSSASYPCYFFQGFTQGAWAGVKGIAFNSAGVMLKPGSGGMLINNVSAFNSPFGIDVTSYPNVRVTNAIVDRCGTGIRCYYNTKVSDSVATNCTYGIDTGTTTYGNYIKDCSLSTNSYGVYLQQSWGMLVEGCTFTGNGYDVYQDQYCCGTIAVGNDHITPTSLAYHRTIGGGPVTLMDCTIDAPSLIKCFQQVSGEQYLLPQYIVQNSFDSYYGLYYAKHKVVRDASTVPPRVQFQFLSTVSVNVQDFKVASCYTASLAGKTLEFKLLAASPGWVGTITPKVKLNGVVIQTEANIVAISDVTPATYTYVVPALSIIEDGELSIEFTVNSNTIAVYVYDFTVT